MQQENASRENEAKKEIEVVRDNGDGYGLRLAIEKLHPEPGDLLAVRVFDERPPVTRRPLTLTSEQAAKIREYILQVVDEEVSVAVCNGGVELHHHVLLGGEDLEPAVDFSFLDGKAYGVLFQRKDHKRIPDDEFVVFRAHDKGIFAALYAYLKKCEQLGCGESQLKGINDLIDRVVAWQQAHPERMKLADVEPGEIFTG